MLLDTFAEINQIVLRIDIIIVNKSIQLKLELNSSLRQIIATYFSFNFFSLKAFPKRNPIEFPDVELKIFAGVEL